MRVFAGEHLTAQRDTDGAILVRWDTPNSVINLPSEDLLAEWELLLNKLACWPRLTLVILASGKKGAFGRGWSPPELARIGNNQRLAAITQAWEKILNRWESLPCPTLATLAGPCLDEALDIALACDYRVAYRSGSTQLGWTSVFRGWPPPPSTLRRLLCLAGIERYARLLILGQTVNATDACKWGLVNLSAQGEGGLRDAINTMKRKAFLGGKSLYREPDILGGKFARRWDFSRFWLRRGMKRVLDRSVSFDHPMVAYGWETLGRSIGDSNWQDSEAAKSVADLAEDRGGHWIRSARESCAFMVTSPIIPKITRVFLLGDSDLEFEIARRALIEKIPVTVGAQSAEDLGRRVMRLGTGPTLSPSAALQLIEGKIFAELSQNIASNQAVVLGLPISSGIDWAGWSRKSAILMADSRNTIPSDTLSIRSLIGKHRSGLVELPLSDSIGQPWLASLGFRTIQHGHPYSIWRVAGAWWAETLRAMAEGLDPFLIEQEARRYGFLKGPLTDLCENLQNLRWLEPLVSPADADLLARWREMVCNRSNDGIVQSKVVGWWKARRWRSRSGTKLSPVLQAMPVSARVAALGSRWIAAILLSCDREDAENPRGLSSLESRVGWPVFRGPPRVAMNSLGETMVSVGQKLAKTFGERFNGLVDEFAKDNP